MLSAGPRIDPAIWTPEKRLGLENALRLIASQEENLRLKNLLRESVTIISEMTSEAATAYISLCNAALAESNKFDVV